MPIDAEAPDSDAEEGRWCAARRLHVLDYLQSALVAHGRVGEDPAWYLCPYVSLWAVESMKAPGWVGWWVIAGDCPTDIVTCDGDRTPRSALRDFASRWREA